MQSAVHNDLRASAHCRIMEMHPILRNPELSVKVTSNTTNDFVPCATSTPARIRPDYVRNVFEPSPIANANLVYERRYLDIQCHPRRATICPLPRSTSYGYGYSRHGVKELAILSGSEDDELLLPRKSLRPSRKGRARTCRKSTVTEKQPDVLCRLTSEVLRSTSNIAPIQGHQEFDPAVSYFNQVIQESEHKVLSWFERNSMIDNKENHDKINIPDNFIQNEKPKKRKSEQNCNSNENECRQCTNSVKKIKLSEVQMNNNPNEFPIKEVTNLTLKMNRQKKGITSQPNAIGNCIKERSVGVGKKRVNNRTVQKTNSTEKIAGKAKRTPGVKVSNHVESNNGPAPSAKKQNKKEVQMIDSAPLKDTHNLIIDNAEVKSEVMIIEVEPDIVPVPCQKVKTREKYLKGNKKSEEVIKSRSTKKNIKIKSKEVATDLTETPSRLPVSNSTTTKPSRIPALKKSNKTISKVVTSESSNNCSTRDRTSLQNPVLPIITSFNEIDNWKEVQGKDGVVFSKLTKNNTMSAGLIKLLPRSVLAKNTCSMQVFSVVQGTGEIKFVDYQKKTKPGDVIYLPIGSEYTIKNIGRKEFVISYVKFVKPKPGSEQDGSPSSTQLPT